MQAFHITVNGDRLFRITPVEGCAVDCCDVKTGFESQSIVGPGDLASAETLLADGQTRDAIASAYYNATSHESGHYPVGGTGLPDDFTTEIVR